MFDSVCCPSALSVVRGGTVSAYEVRALCINFVRLLFFALDYVVLSAPYIGLTRFADIKPGPFIFCG